MRWVYGAAVVGGWALATWARLTLMPHGVVDFPVPVQGRVTTGPYRWLAHPMYVGTTLAVAGCAGLAAGAWNAVAVGTVAELLLREWAWRET